MFNAIRQAFSRTYTGIARVFNLPVVGLTTTDTLSPLINAAAVKRGMAIADATVTVRDADGEIDDTPIFADILRNQDMSALLFETDRDWYLYGIAVWVLVSDDADANAEGTARRLKIQRVLEPLNSHIEADGSLMVGATRIPRGRYVWFWLEGNKRVSKRIPDAIQVYTRVWENKRKAADRSLYPTFVMQSGRERPSAEFLDELEKRYRTAFSPDRDESATTARTGHILAKGQTIEFPAIPPNLSAETDLEDCIQAVHVDSGVSAFELGTQNNLTYSNLGEAHDHFIDKTIAPQAKMFSNMITDCIGDDLLPPDRRVQIKLNVVSKEARATREASDKSRLAAASTVSVLSGKEALLTPEEAKAYYDELVADLDAGA